ncbi:glycosyltransferase involved in cell wall biosynthesis [Maritalea mobilis]|uniref:Glycosyltransferase involved in cell wall biosynthesis n=1 Tax=Maritalea mobilis TaxID=483324 RepID=A0A4R6VG57_9HYPH|nr:glycosyltransferase family 4 protein [Maritalea mobilis]TDQ60440.1 glycosyltransferase involved in cell wall biosynthesis [Maritalea mobilis]
MKVLVMAPDQLMTRAGGLRTQVVRTCQELRHLGHEIEYFDPWKEYNLEKFDVCHVFSMNLPSYFKSQIVVGKLPVVYSSVMWRNGSRLRIRFLVELMMKSPHLVLNDVVACRKMSQTATLILPNTHQEKKWLKEAIGVDVEKCVVIPNGADNHFSGIETAVLKADASYIPAKDFVFCCSVISERKNLLKLANVCVQLKLPLVIAGPFVDKRIQKRLQQLKRSGADITLMGSLDVNSPQLGYLYRSCRVFCLPSYYETPGIAALEAALNGANVVITKIGGAEDYFGNGAKYVDPYSELDIKKQLSRAWNEQDTQSRKAELVATISNSFSWASVAEQTANAYRQAMRLF